MNPRFLIWVTVFLSVGVLIKVCSKSARDSVSEVQNAVETLTGFTMAVNLHIVETEYYPDSDQGLNTLLEELELPGAVRTFQNRPSSQSVEGFFPLFSLGAFEFRPLSYCGYTYEIQLGVSGAR